VGKPRAVAGPASNVVPLNTVSAATAAVVAAQARVANATVAAAQAARVAAEAETTVDTGFGAAPKPAGPKPGANVVIDAVANKPAPQQDEAVETGFATPSVASPSTQNTVEDTGAPEESDLDLDARVAALLQR